MRTIGSRNRTEVELATLQAQVRVLRHHGLKFQAIARVLELDPSWLSRRRKSWGIT